MDLSTLRPAEGSKKSDSFRRGRGHGSGNGKTAGKGHKGQNARSGGGVRPGFEGGQLPLYRKLPKRGFTNHFSKQYAIVNLKTLEKYEAGTVVDIEKLIADKVIKNRFDGLKVLANGELTKALTVKAAVFSASAKAKLEAAGGQAAVI